MDIRVEGLTKSYPTPSAPLVVLREFDLEVAGGATLAVTGPSGSGKSTLLHVLGTLDEPTGGRVLLGGTDPFLLSERELAAFRNEEIGFVFQDHYLLPQCTVLENVLVPTLVAAPGSAPGARERATSLLEGVGLSERLDHRPAELSGGERQRAALARALIRRPGLLLCDEPTGNLDSATARRVGDLLLEIGRREECTLIVVTHSDDLARRFERRVRLVGGGLEEGD